MQTIESKVEHVDGWLNPVEGRLLYRLARSCKKRGAIVEVGSWKGKSTIWLSHGSVAGSGGKVHAIDPHTGSPEHSRMFGEVWTFDEFERNIRDAGMKEMVVPHVDFSDAVAKRFEEPVEFIFIDGLHEYEGVKIDFDAWYPKVVDGGWMAFHDTTCWPGVLKVVVENVFRSGNFRRIGFAKSIVYAQKVSRLTAWERIENRLMLWAFLFHAWGDRVQWRLLHHYFDFPITRAIVKYLKKREARPVTVAGDMTSAAKNTP